MGKYTAFLLIVLLSIVVGGYRVLQPPAVEPPSGGDFSLMGPQGVVDLADFREQVVVLYFGYTSCPDICPTSLAVLGQALAQLPESVAAQGLFISLDPARDTPRTLAEYTGFFHPRLLGVTGSPRQLAQVTRQYGVAYQITETEISHSSQFIVLDKQGQWRETLPHGSLAQDLARHIVQWWDAE